MICEYCRRSFHGDDDSMKWVLCQAIYVCDDCAKKEVMWEECQKHFVDDGDEFERGRFLCETCRKDN